MAEQYKFPDETEVNVNGKDVNVTEQEDDVEIEVIDDTPEKDRGRRPLDREVEDPTDDEIETYTRGAQDRIKELTHARHDERRAKEALAREKQELERLAQQMLEENKRLKQYVSTGTEQYTQMAKTAADAELEKARRDYKAAQEAFDTDAILAAQEALLEAKMKVEQTKNFRPPSLQTQETDVQPVSNSVPRPDQRAVAWQERNDWFGKDEEMTSLALGLHQKLVNQYGASYPSTDEYWKKVDDTMRRRFPEHFEERDPAPAQDTKPQREKPAPVVAPATRSTGSKKVKVSQTAVNTAKRLNVPLEKYVQEMMKLEGRNG